jgi:hypothetical protein
MYTIITLFYVSLLGMVIMIFLKRREIKTGHPTIISRMFKESDIFFHNIFSTIHGVISYLNKHTFIWLAQWVAFHILSRIRDWYVIVRARAHQNPHLKKVLDMVRGRGEIRNHGASFYLRKISNKHE